MAATAADTARDGIAVSIDGLDFMRRSFSPLGGRAGHKEWEHFAILAPGIDLLVNFSCCDDLRGTAATGAEQARLVLLVRAQGWDGDVETYTRDQSTVVGGRIDLTLNGNRLAFRDGAFHIHAALRERPVTVDLRLTPLTMPAFVPSIPMLDGQPLHWVVVPRLHAAGSLVVGDREYCLDGAPAYHDHNWGYFQWGHDVAWEWGFVLPDRAAEPWCLTFVRLTNRARTTALAHKLLLWRGAEIARVFREAEIGLNTELGYLRVPRVFKIPRPMALVAPEQCSDVPSGVETRAAADGDWLACRCRAEDVAQVLIPSESELGVTIFNEVSARATVWGEVGGEPIAFEGRAILEFIRYV